MTAELLTEGDTFVVCRYGIPRMYDFNVFECLDEDSVPSEIEAYTIDPLTGRGFWLTHYAKFESTVPIKRVTLPCDYDFEIDAVRVWKLHSGYYQPILFRKLFTLVVDHVVSNHLIAKNADLASRQVDEHFSIFAHDLTEEGLVRFRLGYRNWMDTSKKLGHAAPLDW